MKSGIIGSGAMGSGIAQVIATAGHTVVLFDTNGAALQKAELSLKNSFAKLVEKGKLGKEDADRCLGNISYADTIESLAEAE
ncbi:MAG TPA: 3-hydroxyacyl-CoA dehydrogenase NAD-binding domain-containing protein, partial [Chitinophagaceae bacterium]|nr:3-hydroxyacyl-CoA dehydrogenase NAD-binding domain-containing protein [Chitinophagaceae bacterium]